MIRKSRTASQLQDEVSRRIHRLPDIVEEGVKIRVPRPQLQEPDAKRKTWAVSLTTLRREAMAIEHGLRLRSANEADSVRHGFYAALNAANASSICATSVGLTTRAISAPSRMKISVGHSLTRNERPSGRPGPSSIFIWRVPGCCASAFSMVGCAPLQ
jgi:hypothetical protein